MTISNRLVFAKALLLLLVSPSILAAPPQPAFDFEHLLDANFHSTNGRVLLDKYVSAFAPEGASTELLLFNDKREVVSRTEFYDSSAVLNGVWSVVKPKPPLEIFLDQPGIYQMVFMVNGEPATRFPFRLVETSAGDDPFNPQTTYAFDGYWKRYAVVRLKDYDFKRKGTKVKYAIWSGQLDLAPGTKKGRFDAQLMHGGKVIAHIKRGGEGFIANEHYRKSSFSLLLPHVKKDAATAPPFLLEDYADGDYNLRITRLVDGEELRNFEFTVANGKMVGLPQSSLSYKPHVDYLMPQVDDDSTRNQFRMEKAVWLMDPP